MKGMIDLNKETFKRRIRKITAFAAAVAMAAAFTFPAQVGEGFSGFGNAIVASAETETGDFTVTGGELDKDYTYANGVLTIKSGTPITIANTNPNIPTTDRIEVAESYGAYITLAGVNIDVSASDNTAAFKNNNTGLEITLEEDSVNNLKSGSNAHVR